MAKRKTAHLAPYQFRPAAASAPIIVASAPRRSPARRAAPKKHHHRRHHAGKGNLQKAMTGAALGGYVIGFIEKTFPTLPTIPVVGKKGTIAIVGYFLAGKGGMIGTVARNVAMVAAGLAGYQFGTAGTVTGNVVPQVSGVAAQV